PKQPKHTSKQKNNNNEVLVTVTAKLNSVKATSLTADDNAANTKAAVAELKFTQFACFALSLNLVVQNAIQSSIKHTIDEVKKIVMHLKKSAVATNKLKEAQKNFNMDELKLKQAYHDTRYNSTYT
uniref:Uncharacterized protein n=1 Tax=Anopheles minimus TaxID=112268 RepID=A0A182W6A0_9DIPT